VGQQAGGGIALHDGDDLAVLHHRDAVTQLDLQPRQSIRRRACVTEGSEEARQSCPGEK
jgi:hypothetical protein